MRPHEPLSPTGPDRNNDFSHVLLHSFGLALDGEVLFPAGATQQVVRVAAAALAAEPAVHVGAVAAVALAVGAAAAARVALLHVLVEVGHAGLAQLAHHHLVALVRLTHVLQTHTQNTGDHRKSPAPAQFKLKLMV